MKVFLIVCVSIGFVLPAVGGNEHPLLEALRPMALPLADAAGLSPLLALAAPRKLVLLGESTHGTSEFYSWRAKISQRLISEKGFRFVAVEGDWASIYRLNRYVKGLPGAEPEARAIMARFDRWPQWMWANTEFLHFVEWLRTWNLERDPELRAGLYGIDVYGEDTVLEKLLLKLRRVDADLAAEAETLYAPFRAFAGNPRAYATHLYFGGASYGGQAETAYSLLRERLAQLGSVDPQVQLNILHSARVIKNVEQHYRANVDPNLHSWNARADHFFLTAKKLLEHYGETAQGIVWAHNTHIGDARATRMSADGSRNIGQSAREALGAANVFAVGFGTDRGTVLAGREWGGAREVMQIPSGGPGSLEHVLRDLGISPVMLLLHDVAEVPAFSDVIGHRAIGVIYHPEREFPGNYVPTRFGRRYDAFLFFAETRALGVLQ
jgi:erythromycin esterase